MCVVGCVCVCVCVWVEGDEGGKGCREERKRVETI